MKAVAFLALALAPMATADEKYLVCGADIVGHDVSTYKSPNPDTCAFLIPNAGDSATWTNYNGGTCWLKHDNGVDVKFTPNAGAASVYNPISSVGGFGVVAYESDKDMQGYDIGSERGTSDACLRSCRANAKCFAFVWTDYNGGTCWFKSRASAFVYKYRALSFIVARPLGPFNACPPS